MKKNIVALLRNRPYFGSQLTSLPSLYYLKGSFPDHNLILAGQDSASSFYSKFAWVDKIIESHNFYDDIMRIPYRPDLMISFQPSSERGALLNIIKRPTLSAGFSKKGNLLSRFWMKRLPFEKSEYRASHYIRLAGLTGTQSFNLSQTLRAPFLELSNKAKAPYENSADCINIVLMPGGGAGEFKKWGHENFISVAFNLKTRIKKRLNIHVILGPDEAHEERQMKQNTGEIAIYFSPDIETLCSIVARSDLVIANDCGPSHIAQCLGIPFVGIYNHENTEWFRKVNTAIMLVPSQGNGIKSIPQGEVLEASLNLLEKSKGIDL